VDPKFAGKSLHLGGIWLKFDLEIGEPESGVGRCMHAPIDGFIVIALHRFLPFMYVALADES
jgi:hypothetical protein